jgi:hypothetical protein
VHKIKKQVCYGANVSTCVLHSSAYHPKFSTIRALVTEALNDFPSLKDDEIEVLAYAGQDLNGTLGIEFQVHTSSPERDIPEGYEVIPYLADRY